MFIFEKERERVVCVFRASGSMYKCLWEKEKRHTQNSKHTTKGAFDTTMKKSVSSSVARGPYGDPADYGQKCELWIPCLRSVCELWTRKKTEYITIDIWFRLRGWQKDLKKKERKWNIKNTKIQKIMFECWQSRSFEKNSFSSSLTFRWR